MSDQEQRLVMMTVRCSLEERRRFNAIAKRERKSLNEWLRETLLEAARHVHLPEEEGGGPA